MAKKVVSEEKKPSAKSVKSGTSKKNENVLKDNKSLKTVKTNKTIETEKTIKAEQPVQIETKAEPKTNWVILFLVCLFLLVIGIQHYLSMSQNDRDQLNQVLASVGLIPWSESARSAVRITTEKSKNEIATSIINLTHPFGIKPKLDSYDVTSNGDVITVYYNCSFKGGFFETDYTLKLKWSFSKMQNFGVSIVKDDTMLGVMPQMMDELNRYFQTEIYPIVLGNAK